MDSWRWSMRAPSAEIGLCCAVCCPAMIVGSVGVRSRQTVHSWHRPVKTALSGSGMLLPARKSTC